MTTGTAAFIVGKELFFFKYYSIAFSILPGVAGGLALELQEHMIIFPRENFSYSYALLNHETPSLIP